MDTAAVFALPTQQQLPSYSIIPVTEPHDSFITRCHVPWILVSVSLFIGFCNWRTSHVKPSALDTKPAPMLSSALVAPLPSFELKQSTSSTSQCVSPGASVLGAADVGDCPATCCVSQMSDPSFQQDTAPQNSKATADDTCLCFTSIYC